MTNKDFADAINWYSVAVKGNKLGSFIIGEIPYAPTRDNMEGVATPTIEPNIKVLYFYYKKSPEKKMDDVVLKNIEQILLTRGNEASVIYRTLIFLNAQLEHEKNGTAAFTLDCTYLLNLVRKSLNENMEEFKKASAAFKTGLWHYVEFYDKHMRTNYNQRVL